MRAWTNKAIRTVIIDDEWAVLETYTSLLQRHIYTTVMNAFLEANALLHWLEYYAAELPDVVLVDIEYQHNEWPVDRLVRRLIELVPDCEVLCISQHGGEKEVKAALEAGAHGLLHKADVGYGLATAVWMTLQRDFLFSPGVAEAIKRHFPELVQRENVLAPWLEPAYLSDSLKDVATRLYLQGKSAAVVAAELKLARKSVHKYGKRVRSKIEDAWHLEWYNQSKLPPFEHLRDSDLQAWLFHVLTSLPGSNWPQHLVPTNRTLNPN